MSRLGSRDGERFMMTKDTGSEWHGTEKRSIDVGKSHHLRRYIPEQCTILIMVELVEAHSI